MIDLLEYSTTAEDCNISTFGSGKGFTNSVQSCICRFASSRIGRRIGWNSCIGPLEIRYIASRMSVGIDMMGNPVSTGCRYWIVELDIGVEGHTLGVRRCANGGEGWNCSCIRTSVGLVWGCESGIVSPLGFGEGRAMLGREPSLVILVRLLGSLPQIAVVFLLRASLLLASLRGMVGSK